MPGFAKRDRAFPFSEQDQQLTETTAGEYPDFLEEIERAAAPLENIGVVHRHGSPLSFFLCGRKGGP